MAAAPLLRKFQIRDVQGDEFCAPERPGIAEQRERPIAARRQIVGHRQQQRWDRSRSKGSFFFFAVPRLRA